MTSLALPHRTAVRLEVALLLLGGVLLFLLVLFLALRVLLLQLLLLQLLLLLLLLAFGIFGGLNVGEVLHAERFEFVVAELLDELLFLGWLHFDHDVFGLEVGVDDLAAFVEVDEAEEDVPRYLLY